MGGENSENQVSHRQKYFLCNQCCFWIFQLIVVALGLAAMSKVIIGYKITKEVLASNQYSHSNETVWLWNQGYIIDIKAESTNNCPEGYQPLISHKWPGSVTGCYCSSNSNGYNFDFVMEGRCSSDLIGMGCNNVNALTAQTMNMWKGQTLLCYKRATSMNFYNSIVTQAPTGGYSPTMTACAVNQTYQVYTLPGISCPITAFSSASVGASQTQLTLDAVNGAYLKFNSQTNYPIAGFKLTEYQFCDFFNTSNISPNKKGTYILQMSSLTDPCPFTDPRMIQSDFLNERDFYTNNTRVYELIQSLPSYPQPSVDYQYLLGYIPYPSWAYHCRSNSAYDLYKTTDKILFKAPQEALVTTASITIVCALILTVLLRLVMIIRHIVDLRAKNSYNALMLTDEQIANQIPNLDIIKSYKKECVLWTIQLLLVLGIAGSIIYSIAVLTKQSVWIKQIIRNKCTDSYLENIFLYYQQSIDKISNLLIEASFIWVVLLIAEVSYFIARNYIGDLYTKEIVASEKAESINQEQINIIEKEQNIQGYANVNESAQIILQKDQNSSVKIYDMEYLMGDIGGGETKDNFFGSLDREASINVSKKKKKKKAGNKKKKLIVPDDDL